MTTTLLTLATMTAHAAPPRTPLIPEDAAQAQTTTGIQIHACEYDSSHRQARTFQHTEATLYDAAGAAIIKHRAGPSWKAQDGSRIVGEKIADAPSPNADNTTRLPLSTHASASGSPASVRRVRRLDTKGGSASATPCTIERQHRTSRYYARDDVC
ncbi:DUF3455 domain-containing protein [Burkholderia pseudomallei]|uniref:DUF3455 domain-containing protein n=1 Tax=Burkholderia pseudomallei TaxID=28450 RepID=UPI0021F7AD4A|nr:DUF3455 domain-containing protein [Burkholderia pseudomallei]MCW0111258.1 DUF3455 domain-containing protein [Burkholderia pseudomallei]